MSATKRILKIYKDKKGKEPFVDWIKSVKDNKTRARIYTRLDRLEAGNPGDHRHIENEVYELRLQFSAGFRIYYGEDDSTIIILLIGGNKSTQQKDIKKALSLWKKYKEAKNENI